MPKTWRGPPGHAQCHKCKRVLPLDEFYADRSARVNRNGRLSYCKDCAKAKGRRHYAQNAEAKRAYARAWRETHPNHEPADPVRARALAAAWMRRKRASAKDACLDHYGRACACCGEAELAFLVFDHIDGRGNEHRRQVGQGIWLWLVREGFPDGFQTLCHNCNHAKSMGGCPHQMLFQVVQEYRPTGIPPPEQTATATPQDRWKANHREQWREYQAQWKRDRRERARVACLDHYGQKCRCCGEAELAFLVMDHLDGGGNEHRRQIGGGSLYLWLERQGFPVGFQPLCWNCNFAKSHGGCPHQSRL